MSIELDDAFKDAAFRDRIRKKEDDWLLTNIDYIMHCYANGAMFEVITYDYEPPPFRRVQLYAEELERRKNGQQE